MTRTSLTDSSSLCAENNTSYTLKHVNFSVSVEKRLKRSNVPGAQPFHYQPMLSRTTKVGRVSSRKFYSTAAPSIPSLAHLDKKWPKLKELDQADIVDHLNAKAQGNWKTLTPEEKRAMYYIYYGEWGPRSTKPPSSVSLTVLKSLFSFVLLIGSGVGLYNYAIDQEYEERLEKTARKVQYIKEREAEEAQSGSKSGKAKGSWLWW